MKHFFEDLLELLSELLDQVLLEVKQLSHNLSHLLKLFIGSARVSSSLVEQMQGIDDSNSAADLLNFDIVLIYQRADLTVDLLLSKAQRRHIIRVLRLYTGIRLRLRGTRSCCLGVLAVGRCSLSLVVILLLDKQDFTLLAIHGQDDEFVVFSDKLLQFVQVVQNSLSEALSEVIVQHFDDATKVLELLDLLPVN